MGASVAKISSESLALSARRGFGMRNAWAKYVRNRWPQNTQAMCEREWDLTPGRANGLVFANVTQNTIDQILDHPRGGILVMLAVLAEKFGTDLAGLIAGVITEMRGRLDHERARTEAADRRLVALSSRFRALLPGAAHLRPRMASDADGREPERRVGVADQSGGRPV